MEYIKQPVIFDTDIGDDIDDTWALLYLLKFEKADVKLIINSMGHHDYRLKIVEKFLNILQKKVDLGIGMPSVFEFLQTCRQKSWTDDFISERNYYPGIEKTVETVMNSPDKVNIISVGSLSNVAAMLSKEPKTAERINLYIMGGSIKEGFFPGTPPIPEANIANDTKASQYVFSEKFARSFPISMSPLDSSRNIIIKGDNYKKLLESKKIEVIGLIDNYKIWSKVTASACDYKDTSEECSSMLFDTLPVYMWADGKGIKETPMKIEITDEGRSIESSKGRPVGCIMDIPDLNDLTTKITNVLLK